MHLLAAAEGFEAIELSPVTPLGTSSTMGPTDQHKVLSALRATEVVRSNERARARVRRAIARRARHGRALRDQPARDPREAVPTSPATRRTFESSVSPAQAARARSRVRRRDADRSHHDDDAHPRSTSSTSVRRTPRRCARHARTQHALAIEWRQPSVVSASYSSIRKERGRALLAVGDACKRRADAIIDGGLFDWVAKLTTNPTTSTSQAGWAPSSRPTRPGG